MAQLVTKFTERNLIGDVKKAIYMYLVEWWSEIYCYFTQGTQLTTKKTNTPLGSLKVIKAFFFSGTKCKSLISPPCERLTFSKYIRSTSSDTVGSTLVTLTACVPRWRSLMTGWTALVSSDWQGSDINMVWPLNSTDFFSNSLAATKWKQISSDKHEWCRFSSHHQHDHHDDNDDDDDDTFSPSLQFVTLGSFCTRVGWTWGVLCRVAIFRGAYVRHPKSIEYDPWDSGTSQAQYHGPKVTTKGRIW